MFDTRMVFLQDFFSKKLILKNQQTTNKHEKFPGGKKLTILHNRESRLNQYGFYVLGLPNTLLMEKKHTHTYRSSFFRITR